MARTLQDEFAWYREHQAELVAQHRGKFLVIKDASVAGAFDTLIAAYTFGVEVCGAGTFFLQECDEGEAKYTATFHSRVSFAR
jgi:hypothetical protein